MREKIFIILTLVGVASIYWVSLGIAYLGGVRGTGLLGICSFVTCEIAVVLGQWVPLLSSILGGS